MAYHGLGTLSQQGDPFIHKRIFGGIKGVIGGFAKGGPLGAFRGGLRGLATGGSKPGRQPFRIALGRPLGLRDVSPPILVGPGGGPGVLAGIPPGVAIDPMTGLPTKKRKRINPANPKALRRAIRRTSGFVKLAKRALKGTGFRIVSSGSRARRDLPAGHAHIR